MSGITYARMKLTQVTLFYTKIFVINKIQRHLSSTQSTINQSIQHDGHLGSSHSCKAFLQMYKPALLVFRLLEIHSFIAVTEGEESRSLSFLVK